MRRAPMHTARSHPCHGLRRGGGKSAADDRSGNRPAVSGWLRLALAETSSGPGRPIASFCLPPQPPSLIRLRLPVPPASCPPALLLFPVAVLCAFVFREKPVSAARELHTSFSAPAGFARLPDPARASGRQEQLGHDRECRVSTFGNE